LQSPPKGATIPYRPSPAPGAVLLAGNQVKIHTDMAKCGSFINNTKYLTVLLIKTATFKGAL